MTSLEFTQELISKIVPKMAYSEENDHEVWRKEAYAKMEDLLGLPLPACEDDFSIEEEKEEEAYKSITFRFQSEPGYYQTCTMLVPKGAKEPLPGVIGLQGHSTGAHLSVGIAKFEGDEIDLAGSAKFAVRAVEEGFCGIALEQRYMGVNGQTAKGDPACIEKNAALPSLLIGRTSIGERVWDVHRLIDIIERYLTTYIDPKQIICMGSSGGGTATVYAACYDERIALAMPACALCTYDDSIIAMQHCCCNYIPNIRTYFEMGDVACLIAPRPVVVVTGKDDPIFPLKGVIESVETMKIAYKKLKAEGNCRFVVSEGRHKYRPDDAWPVVHELLKI